MNEGAISRLFHRNTHNQLIRRSNRKREFGRRGSSNSTNTTAPSLWNEHSHAEEEMITQKKFFAKKFKILCVFNITNTRTRYKVSTRRHCSGPRRLAQPRPFTIRVSSSVLSFTVKENSDDDRAVPLLHTGPLPRNERIERRVELRVFVVSFPVPYTKTSSLRHEIKLSVAYTNMQSAGREM